MQVDIHICIHTYKNATVHTFDMSMSKYTCNIANMHHTAIKLNMHIEPTFLHKCAKTKLTAMSTSHVIIMYLPTTNMLLKCHMHKFLDVHHGGSIPVTMSKINSLASTM